MDKEEADQLCLPLWEDINADLEYLQRRKPLFAHYTSLYVLEQIMKSGEIWFSNPLFMNDLEEVRFGLVRGIKEIKSETSLLRSLGSTDRQETFVTAIDHYVSHFDQEHLLDTYILCWSEHDRNDQDGLLSMWRGYGANGNGAAIIYDPTAVTPEVGTPLVVGRVRYGSNEERLGWFKSMAAKLASIFDSSCIKKDDIYMFSHSAFEVAKMVSIFSKHKGFQEEREWRLLYSSSADTERRLESMLGYFNGPRGIEPKLKLKLKPLAGVIPSSFTLETTIPQIILGPSTNGELAARSVQKMLRINGRNELADRVVSSKIPFRPV